MTNTDDDVDEDNNDDKVHDDDEDGNVDKLLNECHEHKSPGN